jgi:AcrR family transcriptional regulator
VPSKTTAPSSRNRKTQIIAAAETLLQQRGLSATTTRAIAEAVPCSEGAIYVHFESRIELLVAVLEESLPEMLVPLHALADKIGTGTPQKNLIAAMQGLQRFHRRMVPVLGSLFAEPQLLQSFRETLASRGKGPHAGIARIAQYIRQEQIIGRMPAHADPEAIASTLMSVSFFQAFTSALLGQPTPALSAKRIVSALLH